jgi:salicylate hydroxylase
MPSSTQPEVLDIAIIGSGPGGLSAGIALSKLPNVYVRIFEKASAISDLGGGISINHNGWKVLEYLGARKAVTGASTVPTVQRWAFFLKFVFFLQRRLTICGLQKCVHRRSR